MLTPEQKLIYYQHPHLAEGILKTELAKKKQIVYGARASNIHLPYYLQKNTEDYDVLTKKPEQEAKELVKRLNREYGGEYFRNEQAKHKGTYKVVSNVTNKTIADFTRAYKHPKTKEVLGIKYVQPSSIKRAIIKSLKNPEAEFRKDKDMETLQRLRLGERIW
jgi:hypothetical protein